MGDGVDGAGSVALGRVALELCSRPPEVEDEADRVGLVGSDCEMRCVLGGAVQSSGLGRLHLDRTITSERCGRRWLSWTRFELGPVRCGSSPGAVEPEEQC